MKNLAADELEARIETVALDMREKLAHIDQMLADHGRRRQQIRHAPWLIAFAGITGAALFGAGAAVGAIIVKLYFGS